MVRTLKLLAIVSMMTLLPSHLHAGDVDNTPVASLDLSRYLGTWYEIARFDHSFERGMTIRRVRFPPAVRPRFPGQCQSARGQSGPKSKPNGDGDGRDG